MMELIAIYATTLSAAVVVAPSLSLLGCHLAARDRSLQTLCVSQGAMLGVLVALGFLQTIDADGFLALGPLFGAAAGAAIAFFYTEYGISHRASKNTFFAAVFAVLSALGFLATALFPLLESHMTHIYFGDVATLSDAESWVAIGLGFGMLLVFSVGYRTFSRDSFNKSVFGKSAQGNSRTTLLFDLLALFAISACVQFLGFLYTVGFLFLPTSLLVVAGIRGLRPHFIGCAVLSILGASSGFLLSLKYTRLSTVPALLICTLVLGGVLALIPKRRLK